MGLISTDPINNGDALDATVVDGNFNTIVNEFNGAIDETNLSPTISIPNSALAQIEQSVVNSFASDITEYATAASTGDTATPSLPSTLLQEMWRLRGRIEALRGYSGTIRYMDSAAAVTAAAWFEPRLSGPNLLPNPGFEVHSAGTPNAPDGWSLLSTPATVAIENPAHTAVGLEKRSLNIVTDGATEGIQVAIGGLKTGVKYAVGIAYSLTAGTINLVTTGGLATGDYRNLALADASAASGTVEYLQGIVKPTATPGSITVQIYGTASGADFNLHSAWMYELQDGAPIEIPSIPTLLATDSTQDTDVPSTFTSSQWNWETWTPLSLTQYVPYAGYRMIYEVTVSATSTATSDDVHKHAFRMQLNVDGGGASTVDGPYIHVTDADGASNFSVGKIVNMRYIVENPVPGSSYAFTTDIGAYNGGSDHSKITMNPTVNGLQSVSTARLILEKK